MFGWCPVLVKRISYSSSMAVNGQCWSAGFVKVCVCVFYFLLHICLRFLSRKLSLHYHSFISAMRIQRSGIHMISYPVISQQPKFALTPLTAFQLLSIASQLIQRWSSQGSCSIICPRISRFFLFCCFFFTQSLLLLSTQPYDTSWISSGLQSKRFWQQCFIIECTDQVSPATYSHNSF